MNKTIPDLEVMVNKLQDTKEITENEWLGAWTTLTEALPVYGFEALQEITKRLALIYIARRDDLPVPVEQVRAWIPEMRKRGLLEWG